MNEQKFMTDERTTNRDNIRYPDGHNREGSDLRFNSGSFSTFKNRD